MAGASPELSVITINVDGEFYSQVKDTSCRTYSSDLRVYANATGLYTYPDITVVCGEPEFVDERRDVLLNPTVIVEVLSPSTESYDLGEKGEHYRQITSLTDYILVSQEKRWGRHYARRGDNEWMMTDTTAPDSDVGLPSIGCSLRFTDISRGY